MVMEYGVYWKIRGRCGYPVVGRNTEADKEHLRG